MYGRVWSYVCSVVGVCVCVGEQGVVLFVMVCVVVCVCVCVYCVCVYVCTRVYVWV